MKHCDHCGVPLQPGHEMHVYCRECGIAHAACSPCARNILAANKRRRSRREVRGK